MSDLEWVLHQDEGQFFERKGCGDTTDGLEQTGAIGPHIGY